MSNFDHDSSAARYSVLATDFLLPASNGAVILDSAFLQNVKSSLVLQNTTFTGIGGVLSASQVLAGYLQALPSGAISVMLPEAADIVAALASFGVAASAGLNFDLFVKNSSSDALTITNSASATTRFENLELPSRTIAAGLFTTLRFFYAADGKFYVATMPAPV